MKNYDLFSSDITLEFQEFPSDLLFLLVMSLNGFRVIAPIDRSFTPGELMALLEEIGAGITVALFISQHHSLILIHKYSEPTALKMLH